jgi:hypothetical protein
VAEEGVGGQLALTETMTETERVGGAEMIRESRSKRVIYNERMRLKMEMGLCPHAERKSAKMFQSELASSQRTKPRGVLSPGHHRHAAVSLPAGLSVCFECSAGSYTAYIATACVQASSATDIAAACLHACDAWVRGCEAARATAIFFPGHGKNGPYFSLPAHSASPPSPPCRSPSPIPSHSHGVVLGISSANSPVQCAIGRSAETEQRQRLLVHQSGAKRAAN